MVYSNEQILARQCIAGNPIAQRQLFDLYKDRIAVLCSRYIANTHDAQDVLSDTFYTILRNIDKYTYSGQGSLQAWLTRIAINQCLMYLRRKKMAFVDEPDVVEAVAVNEEVFANLSVKEIMQLITQLPDGYRTVFNLYQFEGQSHMQIAALLGISDATSRTQLFKAKAWLQKAIISKK